METALLKSKIRDLEPSEPVCIEPGVTVMQAIQSMRRRGAGCVVICEQGRPVGIFTERDVLKKIAGEKVSLDSPVSRLMTEGPKTLTADNSLSDAIKLMNDGDYRHLPIVDAAGKVEGLISIQHIVRFLAELYPAEVLNLPPRPHQHMASREGG